MSEAYASTLNISFDIKGGLLIRQIHHWAALMFIVALSVHMFRVFFTGAFRKPREINWVIGSVLALLAIIEGFAGYSLPDDLLSGTGLRATEGFMQTVPVIGSYLCLRDLRRPVPGRDDHPPPVQRAHPAASPPSSSGCSRRTSGWSSCRSTPSSPGRAAPTRTSSATR